MDDGMEDGMERGSDKHGARMDDALAEEVGATGSSRAQDSRDPEPSGEDQPDVAARPDGARHGGVPVGMTEVDVELRSEVAQALGKEIYPATGAELVAKAQEGPATDRVLGLLRRLPAQETFTNASDIWTSLGGGVEQQRF